MHPASVIVSVFIRLLNISQSVQNDFRGLASQKLCLNESTDILEKINLREEIKKCLLHFQRDKLIDMNINASFMYPILLRDNFLRAGEYNFVFMDTFNFSDDISHYDGNKRDKFFSIQIRRYHPKDIFKVANDTLNYFWTEWITSVVVFICCNSNNEVVLYSYAPFTPRVCKSVEIYELSDWTNEEMCFPDKYKNFHQCPIRVLHMNITIPMHLYGTIEEISETMISQYMATVLRLLSDALNFRIDWVMTEYSKVGSILKNGTATLRMALLINRSVDISDVQSRFSIYETSVLERTSLYFTGDYNFVMKNFVESFNWKNFIYPFSTIMWFSIILSWILTGFIVTIYKRVTPVPRSTYSLLNLWSMFLGISSVKMNNNSFKLQVSIWLVYSLIITNAYQGILVGFLTTPRKYNLIYSLEELLESGMPFGVVSNNETMEKIRSILNGEEFAITKSRDSTEYMNTHNPDTKQLHIIPEPIVHYTLQYQLPKGSPWFSNINLVVSQLFECGITEKIRRNVYGDSKFKNIRSNNSPVVLKIDHMFPVFVLYIIGILFAIVVFIVEIALF
ncbi:uncharacterized protein LOC107264218 [Cephus cinctus]|uniref:Uncharacterized protein LOC107264218 n=1 Tax=Cephus cinctus TaxID=211228 RepID=A0AAJ7RAK8_CEPCN|nr:uncharacterized protein LOC107264218 [Cephus cinctus]